MKPFPVERFLFLVRNLQKMASEQQESTKQISEEWKKQPLSDLDDLIKQCEFCHLPITADQFRRIRTKLKEQDTTFKDLSDLFPEAMNRIQDESKRHIVMTIEPEHAKYFSNAQFFDPVDTKGNKVSVAFPSASEDISEVGKCLACGRSTACVMHLSRVVECGLQALAKAVGVKSQHDWGKYLSEIDTELQKRMKAAGARTPDEQFYSEAWIVFDAVRRAWRNPTMHVEKTYTPEHGEEILIAVRSFMRHLAMKLHD